MIDDGPVRPFQVFAISLCALVAFLDGADTQSIAVAAPIIADNLKLTRAALGPLFSAALLGAAIGALTFGPLGDRFGRKRMLVLATIIFGVFTWRRRSRRPTKWLLAIRFAAGIGLGGATPCFLALASEFSPGRRRAMVASLIWAAFPLGGTAGGFANSYILTNFGWQAIFWVGGVLPLIVAAALLIWLPESLRFLIATRQDPERVAAIVRRIDPIPAGRRALCLRRGTHRRRAAQTPVCRRPGDPDAFCSGFPSSWRSERSPSRWSGPRCCCATTALRPPQASIVIGIHFLGALIGMGSAGRLMERFGTVPILCPALFLGAIVTAMLGYAATSMASMSAALFLIGLFVGMGASGAIALAALTYPTAIRSSGIGWAMGMGRFGQVLAPLLASALIAASWSNIQLFFVDRAGAGLWRARNSGAAGERRDRAPAAGDGDQSVCDVMRASCACGHPSRCSAFGLAPQDEGGVCGPRREPRNTLSPHSEERRAATRLEEWPQAR